MQILIERRHNVIHLSRCSKTKPHRTQTTLVGEYIQKQYHIYALHSLIHNEITYNAVKYSYPAPDGWFRHTYPMFDRYKIYQFAPIRIQMNIGTLFVKSLWAHDQNLEKYTYFTHEYVENNNRISSHFCTSHGGWAIVACANLLPDGIIDNIIGAN